MVESTDIELIHKDLLDVSIQLVNAPSQRGWIHWRYQPEFCDDADGDCPSPENKFSESEEFPESGTESGRYDSVSELWTAQWWRDAELQLPHYLPRNILAIGIATDETVITMTGENSMMPMYTDIIDIMNHAGSVSYNSKIIKPFANFETNYLMFVIFRAETPSGVCFCL